MEGRRIIYYRGLVAGKAIIGGRFRAYEQALEKAQRVATDEIVERATIMKANTVIGVDIDYEVFGEGGVMMVFISGKAVLLSG